MMLMGAYTAFYVTFITVQPLLGLLAAIGAGAVMCLIIAFISIAFHADR